MGLIDGGCLELDLQSIVYKRLRSPNQHLMNNIYTENTRLT
jgi:hypothetical protein